MKTLMGIATDSLEEQFPKGKCKERGHALVLIADILIKGREEMRKAMPKGYVKKVDDFFGLCSEDYLDVKKEGNVLVFDNIVRKILRECKKQNKKSATFTLEDVGKFEHCDLILKVIPKE